MFDWPKVEQFGVAIGAGSLAIFGLGEPPPHGLGCAATQQLDGMKQPESLQAVLAEVLPEIDETFSKAGKPISERSMDAARLFVEYVVVDVKGDTKDDYLRKPWFSAIFIPIQEWFIKRYGSALVHPKRNALGVVKHFGAIYLLLVPLTLTKPQDDGTCWITFAKDVFPDEDATNWIQNGPAIASLRSRQVIALRREATKVAAVLRGIANDLMTADVEGDRGMVASVLRHLGKAASDMCGSSSESASLAVWELQMACEKVIKAYLAQEGIDYPATHDLRELNRLAPAQQDWSAVKLALGNFPSEGRVMRWRYQEIAAPSTEELWRYYGQALLVCSTYASRMSRRWSFNNFSVHLRKPPWLSNVLG